MKAIVYHQYGPPEVLKLEEMEKPAPGENEVLIRVRAASVNPLDWHFMRGVPGFLRLITGPGKPKSPLMGRDLAGEVEAVGKDVRHLKPGNAVYGTGRGAFAEFACAPESTLSLKPEGVTFEEAASVPIAGLTALQALRDKARVQPGQKVLINGAAGGVGTFAVQMGKWIGAEITAVCSARNAALVRELGADEVIDYNGEDFTRSSREFDAILECVGNHPFSACRHVLKPGGVYVGIGGGGPDRTTGALLASMMENKAVSWFSNRKMAGMVAKANTADLNLMGDLMAAEELKPVIDRRFQLPDVAEAIRYLEGGHARGKVVVMI